MSNVAQRDRSTGTQGRAELAVAEVNSATNLSGLTERQLEAFRRSLTKRRRELGLSMSELARRIGVSPSLVSQIERGQTLPSVATLFALGTALGGTVDMFFAEAPAASAPPDALPDGRVQPDVAPPAIGAAPAPAHERLYVVRAGNRARIEIKGGVHWERLTPGSLGDAEFLELVYAPRAESDPNLYRHPGMELVLVLDGRFDIYIGFECYELYPGDSITFPSSLPHRYVNPTDSTSRAVTFIFRESVGARDFALETDTPSLRVTAGLPGPRHPDG